MQQVRLGRPDPEELPLRYPSGAVWLRIEQFQGSSRVHRADRQRPRLEDPRRLCFRGSLAWGDANPQRLEALGSTAT